MSVKTFLSPGFRARGRTLALAAAGPLLLAGCQDDPTSTLSSEATLSPGVMASAAAAAPIPGTIAGDDWKSYANKAQLKAKGYFWWFRSEDVYDQVDLVPDPLFGQVARVTFKKTNDHGFAPRIDVKFGGKALDHIWYRFKMRWSPGWTTASPFPAGHANSYKLAFWYWEPGQGGRGQIEISNTDQYLAGMGVANSAGQYLRYKEKSLPGSAPDFGRITSEWKDGEWWEYVIHYHKTGPTTARNEFWRRRLTSKGAVAPGAWVYVGSEFSGATTPRTTGIGLGANKNKSNPSTMHIDWGPWEVIDGSKQPDPFGLNGGTPAPPPSPAPATLKRVHITPASVTLPAGATQQFAASGRMSDGSTTAVKVTYTAKGGTITGGGLYTAGTAAGTFRVIATDTASGLADTAAVTIQAAASTLKRVHITPASATLPAGATQQFAASGRMSDGSTTAVKVTYTAKGGTITGGGLYTAGTAAGTFRVIATDTASGLADTAAVTIQAAAPTLTRIKITPASATLPAGATQQFAASGRMSDGSTTAVKVTYTAKGGTITGGGLYTAGTAAGTFRVIATDTASGLADTAAVTIQVAAPTLVRVNVSPGRVSLQVGQTQHFKASGQMSDGRVVPVKVAYTAAGGTITGGGLYTAGTAAGTFRVIATDTASGLADTAAVTIQAAAPTLKRVQITPASATLPAGATQQFAASGRMSDGSTTAVKVTYTAKGGTITGGGLYTAGTAAGTFRVIATHVASGLADTAAVTITASSIPTLPTVPPSNGGSFSRLAGDDWAGYASASQLSRYYSAGDLRHVDLVADPLFGQVVRITQPAGSTISPVLEASLGRGYRDVWFRWRMRFSPGWTDRNSRVSGANNFTIAGLSLSGSGTRGDMRPLLVGEEYQLSYAVRDAANRYVRYQESVLPGSASDLGRVNGEWSDGDWWEFVVHHQSSGKGGQLQIWRRRATANGSKSPGPWTYYGLALEGNEVPLATAVQLGLTKTKPTPSQYIDWGPWDVVDGARYSNPFDMPNMR